MPFLLYKSDICFVLLGYKAKIWPVKYTCTRIQSPVALAAVHSKAAIQLFVIHCCCPYLRWVLVLWSILV